MWLRAHCTVLTSANARHRCDTNKIGSAGDLLWWTGYSSVWKCTLIPKACGWLALNTLWTKSNATFMTTKHWLTSNSSIFPVPMGPLSLSSSQSCCYLCRNNFLAIFICHFNMKNCHLLIFKELIHIIT